MLPENQLDSKRSLQNGHGVETQIHSFADGVADTLRALGEQQKASRAVPVPPTTPLTFWQGKERTKKQAHEITPSSEAGEIGACVGCEGSGAPRSRVRFGSQWEGERRTGCKAEAGTCSCCVAGAEPGGVREER